MKYSDLKALVSLSAEFIYDAGLDHVLDENVKALANFDAEKIADHIAEHIEPITAKSEMMSIATNISNLIAMLVCERRKIDDLDIFMSAKQQIVSDVAESAYHRLSQHVKFGAKKKKKVF
jgi:hypothetical protein